MPPLFHSAGCSHAIPAGVEARGELHIVAYCERTVTDISPPLMDNQAEGASLLAVLAMYVRCDESMSSVKHAGSDRTGYRGAGRDLGRPGAAA